MRRGETGISAKLIRDIIQINNIAISESYVVENVLQAILKYYSTLKSYLREADVVQLHVSLGCMQN